MIHPTAIVEPGAKLAPDVEVGAYAFIGAGVELGPGTKIHHHATVEGRTSLGSACEVYPYACVGARTQDLKFKGGNPGLRVGDRNTFREYVSIHAATNDGDFTVIGSDNNILAYGHVAHDCVIGDDVVMSNGSVLAGHCQLGDHAVLGGYAGVHQFCQIGAFAMVSACAKLVHDLPPFMIADGIPATVRAYNRVGLERRGRTPEQLERVKDLFRLLYREKLNRTQALERITADPAASTAEFQAVLEFAKLSTRGLAPGGS